MASLAFHCAAALFLFPIGIRRLHSSSSLYLNNPSLYRSKLWFFSEPRWKNIDFYILLFALPMASFSEFFLFLTFSGNPTYKFAFFQQSFVVFSFWLLIILIILREYIDPCWINESFVFVFAGIAFINEFSVIGKGITGLGGTVYEFLGWLTLVCAACCLYLSIKPSAFFADFLLSTGLVFKASWLLQTGLSLYSDVFSLEGCQRVSIWLMQGNADVLKCDLEDYALRGIALMNLLFAVHAILGLIVAVALFCLLSSNRNLRCSEGRGQSLADLDLQNAMLRAHHELELE